MLVHKEIVYICQVGFLMNIVCVVVNMVAINTYGVAMFSLDQFPDWANSTLACAPLEPNTTLARL